MNLNKKNSIKKLFTQAICLSYLSSRKTLRILLESFKSSLLDKNLDAELKDFLFYFNFLEFLLLFY